MLALSVGGVGEAAVPRDSASNTRLSEKEGCVLLFFFLLILSHSAGLCGGGGSSHFLFPPPGSSASCV